MPKPRPKRATEHKLLSKRQQAFVDAFTGPAKGVAWRACKLAGYKGNQRVLEVQGTRLLKNAGVRSAIERANDEVRAPTVATRKEMQEFYTQVMRGELDEEVLLVVGLGSNMGEEIQSERKQADVRTRLDGAKTLGKMQGHFIDRIEVRAEEELKKALVGLRKVMGGEAWTFEKITEFFAEGD